eukprot:7942_1
MGLCCSKDNHSEQTMQIIQYSKYENNSTVNTSGLKTKHMTIKVKTKINHKPKNGQLKSESNNEIYETMKTTKYKRKQCGGHLTPLSVIQMDIVKSISKTMQADELWSIGYNHCINDSIDPDASYSLLKSDLSDKIYNKTTNIFISSSFNIYQIISNHKNDIILDGFMREFQNTFLLYIPNEIIQICYQFLGKTYSEYLLDECNNDMYQLNIETHLTNNINVKRICVSQKHGHYETYVFALTNNELFLLGNKAKLQPLYKSSKPDVAIGGDYIMIVKHGKVWSVGQSHYGALGHGPEITSCADDFKQIRALDAYTIISVCIGDEFAVFLDDIGNVFSCGSNLNACLGTGNDKLGLPSKIEYFVEHNIKIIKIKCGEAHVIALDENGIIYCWGDNQYGQCAVNNSGSISINLIEFPVPVTAIGVETVIDIRIGLNHTGCITENGNFFLWGCNAFSKCCKELSEEETWEPMCVNNYVYDKTNKNHIVDMVLGQNITMFLVKETKQKTEKSNENNTMTIESKDEEFINNVLDDIPDENDIDLYIDEMEEILNQIQEIDEDKI